MKHLLYTFIASFLLAFASCMGEEDFTVSATDSLKFSIDTLSFDTILAGQATNTYTLQAFNNSKKSLRISRIALGKNAESPFAVNVDGTWLKDGNSDATTADFTIAPKDSIRIFVQLLAPITEKDEPQPLEDVLSFTLESGRHQQIVLNASSQDVNLLKGLVISENTVLASARPYQILDSLVVTEGVTLTLKAGTRLFFHPDASLIVHGKLKAEGTLEAPVVFRGDRLGNMFDGQPYDRVPGQWGGITFAENSFGNDMMWCDIHSGTYGIRCDSSHVDKQKLIIDNSIIHNVSGDALSAKMCQVYVGNCQITNAGGNCVNLVGGDYTFVHCTIGQFYAFTGGRGVALNFTNHEYDTPAPLSRCQFINCLVSGYNDDDVMGDASDRYADCPFNFIFKNCLLNTPKIDDTPTIEDCLFEDKKDYDYKAQNDSTIHAGNFYPEFDLDQLRFYFTLNPKSRAVDAADAELTKQSGYNTDLRGNSRFADGKPDIGAYEATKEE